MEPDRDILIIGGPNGAGKTTAARVLLRDYLDESHLLNADEIARELSPDNPEAVAFAAGRKFIERMRRLVCEGKSFAFETTCAGRAYLRLLRECRRDGWHIMLLFLWLPSPESAVSRVAQRVIEGGHNVQPDVVYRRYWAGIWNMRNLYLPLAEEAEIYDNSETSRIFIAEKRKGSKFEIHDPERWARIEGVPR